MIDGEPGEPKNLTIKKTVSYAGKFYITHVIEDEEGINKYSNRWQSWTFNIKDDEGNVPTPAPSPYPEPAPSPVDPTPVPVPDPEPEDPFAWPSGGWPDVKRPDRTPSTGKHEWPGRGKWPHMDPTPTPDEPLPYSPTPEEPEEPTVDPTPSP